MKNAETKICLGVLSDYMDFILMTRRNSYMFITGPEVIETVTGAQVTMQDLGGPTVHLAPTIMRRCPLHFFNALGLPHSLA
jgi:hypothetical protein